MNWILIGVVLLLIFVFLKGKEVRHRVVTIVVIAIVVFFVLTFSQVISHPDVNFTSFQGIVSAGKVYLFWLQHLFGNLGRVSGYAVKLDWGTNLSAFKP